MSVKDYFGLGEGRQMPWAVLVVALVCMTVTGAIVRSMTNEWLSWLSGAIAIAIVFGVWAFCVSDRNEN